jgi:hypothetical protein
MPDSAPLTSTIREHTGLAAEDLDRPATAEED